MINTNQQPGPVTLVMSPDDHTRMTARGNDLTYLRFPEDEAVKSGSYRIVFWGVNPDGTWTMICEPLLH